MISNPRVEHGQRKRAFCLSFAVTLMSIQSLGHTANPWDTWPDEPIKISPVEGVIESFWMTRVKSVRRWRADNGRLEASWDATHFYFEAGKAGESASMARTYAIDLKDYDRLIVRLTPGEVLTTSVTAVVDGRTQELVKEHAGSNRVLEISGPLRGKKLTQLTIRFTASKPGEHKVRLRWVMLDKPGASWTPPKEPLKGMIVERSVKRFDPGLGIILSTDDLHRMRAKLRLPVYQSTWKGDLEYAARQYKVDPVSLLRPYSMYVPSRYGRKSDEAIPTLQDGIMLALVGLLTENEEYLRRAAGHAVVLAHIEHWSEGFVDRFPGYTWYHSGFAPNTATIKASLLLDWTWHYLTPKGRALIRKAIAEKGLPRIWPARNAMANQGVRFNKGLILGKLALADSLDDPELRKYVVDCLGRINPKLRAIVRSDGSFSEGFDYGSSTLTSALISYQAASRCLGVSIAELATPRMLPAMQHVLLDKGDLNPVLAAFCAGPLGDKSFQSQCTPAGLLHSHDRLDHPTKQTWAWWPSTVNRTEYVSFGLHVLWAPEFHSRPQQPRLQKFSYAVAQSRSSDTPPVNGGKRSLDVRWGPVNVGHNQEYIRNIRGATVAAWVKVTKNNLKSQENYVYQSSGTPSSRLHLQVRGRGTPQEIGTLTAFMRRIDREKTASLFSTATIEFDRWVHVAFSVDYEMGKYAFYINGENAGSGSTGLSLGRSQDSPTPQNWVGAGSGHNHWPGLIDDLRIYRRALTQTEVTRLTKPLGKNSDMSQGLVLHYDFEGSGSGVKDLAINDGTIESVDNGVIPAGSGWVFLGSDDPLAPRWGFESGFWDMQGHAWRHKHSLTMRAWGEKLLIERNILSYTDARSPYTQKTRGYNVFSPGERDQSPRAGRGGDIRVAKDLGPVAVIESDNASAWASGVQRALRRTIMVRPNLMVVHDQSKLSQQEAGIQNWTSLRPWQVEGSKHCISQRGNAAVRLHGILPVNAKLISGEDSVSEEKVGVVPVYRAAFTSPASKRHEILTVIEAISPDAAKHAAVTRRTDGGVDLRQNGYVTRVLTQPGKEPRSAMFGFETDGTLMFVVMHGEHPVVAGAFDATWLKGPNVSVAGDGFVFWSVKK